jgi:hypothetical protein
MNSESTSSVSVITRSRLCCLRADRRDTSCSDGVREDDYAHRQASGGRWAGGGVGVSTSASRLGCQCKCCTRQELLYSKSVAHARAVLVYVKARATAGVSKLDTRAPGVPRAAPVSRSPAGRELRNTPIRQPPAIAASRPPGPSFAQRSRGVLGSDPGRDTHFSPERRFLRKWTNAHKRNFVMIKIS